MACLPRPRIPNAEIKEIFETIVIKWFDNSTRKCDRNALFDAVWNGDSEGITRDECFAAAHDQLP